MTPESLNLDMIEDRNEENAQELVRLHALFDDVAQGRPLDVLPLVKEEFGKARLNRLIQYKRASETKLEALDHNKFIILMERLRQDFIARHFRRRQLPDVPDGRADADTIDIVQGADWAMKQDMFNASINMQRVLATLLNPQRKPDQRIDRLLASEGTNALEMTFQPLLPTADLRKQAAGHMIELADRHSGLALVETGIARNHIALLGAVTFILKEPLGGLIHNEVAAKDAMEAASMALRTSKRYIGHARRLIIS